MFEQSGNHYTTAASQVIKKKKKKKKRRKRKEERVQKKKPCTNCWSRSFQIKCKQEKVQVQNSAITPYSNTETGNNTAHKIHETGGLVCTAGAKQKAHSEQRKGTGRQPSQSLLLCFFQGGFRNEIECGCGKLGLQQLLLYHSACMSNHCTPTDPVSYTHLTLPTMAVV